VEAVNKVIGKSESGDEVRIAIPPLPVLATLLGVAKRP